MKLWEHSSPFPILFAPIPGTHGVRYGKMNARAARFLHIHGRDYSIPRAIQQIHQGEQNVVQANAFV